MPFESEKLAPDTWRINGTGCTAYLVCGENEGAMIDTGDSTEDLRVYAENLCGKSVRMVMNTHGHFDHTGGNGFFKVAFMGRKAAEIAKLPNGGQPISEYPLDYPIVIVDDGYTLDLGNREFEAFRMDGHSPDCIAWLDKRERILFAGDNMNMVPMKYKCVDPQPSMLLYMQSVAKLLTRREDYDWILVGHGKELISADQVNHTMMAALRALDGELDKASPPPHRPGEQKPGARPGDHGPDFSKHNPEDNGYIEYKGARIMFNKRYLKDSTRYDTVIGT
jgi:glyoxylase-like metal-dependent hydrolase (beta-lactamase superfamily II)